MGRYEKGRRAREREVSVRGEERRKGQGGEGSDIGKIKEGAGKGWKCCRWGSGREEKEGLTTHPDKAPRPV